MKIDVIKIIQNALIGGTNGDMAYKYNNQFVRELFDNYKFDGKATSGNYEDDKFKEFLMEILNDNNK